MAKVFNSNNFKEEVLNAKEPVLVDFWATWCGPCKMMIPVVDQISNEKDGYDVGKVNVDDEPGLAQQYGIVSIPTMIVFKDGEPVERLVGVRPKDQLLKAIKKHK